MLSGFVAEIVFSGYDFYVILNKICKYIKYFKNILISVFKNQSNYYLLVK